MIDADVLSQKSQLNKAWKYRKVVLHTAVNRTTLVQFQVLPLPMT